MLHVTLLTQAFAQNIISWHLLRTCRWGALQRSVRVEGRVTKVTAAESDAYFAVRPRGSRLGAWVSDQSRPVASRSELDSKQTAIEARFPSGSSGSDVQEVEVPRPPHWGGYRITPDRVEFWSGQPSRLHDRLVYTRDSSSSADSSSGAAWSLERLQP
jgi:pyridoxamine 5'-phosphate oxidase